MPETRQLDLSDHDLQIVERILQARIPDRPVFAFGSRVKGRAQRRSDLDLAVGGSGQLTLSQQADLREDFTESDLPIFVDVIDLNTITPDFRQRIEPDLTPLRAAPNDQSPGPDDDQTPFDKLREHCGVMAIYNHPDAARLTYWGLYALQHRGQESAGIAVSDGEQRHHRHQGHGPRLRDLHRSRPRPAPRPHRHRPHPLLHHRRLRPAQRPAHLRRLHQGPHRHRPQRQPRQPRHRQRPPRARRRHLLHHLRLRDHRPAHRPLALHHPRRLHRRRALPGRWRLLHRHDDPQPHLRRPRPARLPPPLHGPHPRRRRRPRHLRLRLRNLRLRPAPRKVRARRRTRRTHHGL